MVEQGIVLGHIVSSKGIEVDKSKINLVHSLPLPTSVREVRYFLGHMGLFLAKQLAKFNMLYTMLQEL